MMENEYRMSGKRDERNRIITMIEVYVASHFGRFAFEVVPRRSGYLTSHDLRARSRAGSHAIGPYVFSNALRALQQARLSRRWAPTLENSQECR